MSGNSGYKGNLKAERVVWMSRTSDVIGSHIKKDMEAYLTLIRRKIQEKCATTQELINQIRKTKVGDGSFVTPNEFRYTLIKFGLIFPQSLVDKIFAVFDSDRSGTMDFDEFAMWIMNSEFRPVVREACEVRVSPEEALRMRLDEAVKSNSSLFKYMKREISYLDLISAINDKKMKSFTEKDARHLFQLLDPKRTGFLECKKIVRWAETGHATAPPDSSRDDKPMPSLMSCVHNICSRSYSMLRHCFIRLPPNLMQLGFDEFKSCLLQEGLGTNRKDLEALFVALGGKYVRRSDDDGYTVTGTADIGLLLSSLPADKETQEDPSQKARPSAVTITSRADRRLRDAVRKCYKVLKNELDLMDPSGYIEPEGLLKVINKYCMPLAFEDFRVVIQKLNTEGKKVCWQHFLHLYNPKKAPHMLDGSKTISEFVMSPVSSPSSTKRPEATNELLKTTSSMSNTTDMSMTRTMSAGDIDSIESKMRKVWQTVLRECQRSDPERTGVVNKNTFVNALENAGNGSFTSDHIIQLSTKYGTADGLVDYVSCFRNYLNDLASNMAKSTSESTFKAPTMTASRELKHMHPWEFNYKRKERDALPYWKQACSRPKKDFVAELNEKSLYGRSGHKSAAFLATQASLDAETKETLLKKYEPKLLHVCRRCTEFLMPLVKDLRNEFKRARHVPGKDEVLIPKFLAILHSFNIDLTSGEMGTIARAFRGKGMPEAVMYEDFLGLVKILCN